MHLGMLHHNILLSVPFVLFCFALFCFVCHIGWDWWLPVSYNNRNSVPFIVHAQYKKDSTTDCTCLVSLTDNNDDLSINIAWCCVGCLDNWNRTARWVLWVHLWNLKVLEYLSNIVWLWYILNPISYSHKKVSLQKCFPF